MTAWSDGSPATGSIRSPRPAAIAGLPAKNQGTSLPMPAPISARRAIGQSSPQTTAAARRMAAASLEPPPRPAPEGTSLVSSTSRPRSIPAAAARRCAARTTRFESSAGTSRQRTAPAGWASRPPKRTRSRTPGESRARTTSRSASDTGTMSDSISWNPSGRRARIASDRLSLAGAAITMAAGSSAIRPMPTGRPSIAAEIDAMATDSQR